MRRKINSHFSCELFDQIAISIFESNPELAVVRFRTGVKRIVEEDVPYFTAHVYCDEKTAPDDYNGENVYKREWVVGD